MHQAETESISSPRSADAALKGKLSMSRQKFTDKTSGENYSNGIEYFAVGLVVDCSMANGTPNKSGKDYLVEYIDPFGRHVCTWRASDEIVVSHISDEDYDYLMSCYKDVKGS